MKMSVWGVRISRGVPVNDPRYSVNEGCFSDLLHTRHWLRSSRAAFHQPFIIQQTQRQPPERSTNRKQKKKNNKLAFPFFHPIKHLLKQTWQRCFSRGWTVCCNIKKHKYPYVRIWSQTETAPRGGHAFDPVACCSGCAAFDVSNCHVLCGKAGLSTLPCRRFWLVGTGLGNH